MSTTFAARLNRLFDTVYPPGRGPHTSAEVIAALKAEGITMSAPYLSQLRSGNRTNPSGATMAALANFFRIKAAYFTDDEYYEKLERQRNTGVVLTVRARALVGDPIDGGPHQPFEQFDVLPECGEHVGGFHAIASSDAGIHICHQSDCCVA